MWRGRTLVYGGMALLGAASVAFGVLLQQQGLTLLLRVFCAAALFSALLGLWNRLMRRRVRVTVTRERSVTAPPDRVWELVSSAEAWSLRPAHHAFDVPPVAGWPPLRAVIRVRPRVACYVQEIAELPASAGSPDRTLVLRSAGLPESVGVTLSITVTPEGPGTRVVMTTNAPRQATLANALDVAAVLRADLTTWLARCESVLTAGRDWPGQEMASDVLATLAAPLPAGRVAAELSASTLIAVDPYVAWAAIIDPTLKLPGDNDVACGIVPGGPVGQAGEVRYSISSQRSGGALTADVTCVLDIEPGRLALMRGHSRLQDCEMVHLVEPAAGGTRYTLTLRLAGRRFRKQQQQAIIRATVEKYGARVKDFLEDTTAPQRG